MKDLFPAVALSLVLHILVFGIFVMGLNRRVGAPPRGPIMVRLLGPSGAAPVARRKGPAGVSKRQQMASETPRKGPSGPPKRVPKKSTPPETETEKHPLSGTEFLQEGRAVKKETSEKRPQEKSQEGPIPEGKEQTQAPPLGQAPGPSGQNRGPLQGSNLKRPGLSLPEGLTMRQLLPGDLIARTARRPLEESLPEEEKPSITFSTKKLKYEAYLMRLKERVENIWVYPREAIERGIYGDLIIEFAIKKEGSLAYARVVRTSGFEILDEAALRALREGQPYWPLPDSWHEDILRIRGHFIYTLGGMYIR